VTHLDEYDRHIAQNIDYSETGFREWHSDLHVDQLPSAFSVEVRIFEIGVNQISELLC